jgi:hypothetical protein
LEQLEVLDGCGFVEKATRRRAVFHGGKEGRGRAQGLRRGKGREREHGGTLRVRKVNNSTRCVVSRRNDFFPEKKERLVSFLRSFAIKIVLRIHRFPLRRLAHPQARAAHLQVLSVPPSPFRTSSNCSLIR